MCYMIRIQTNVDIKVAYTLAQGCGTLLRHVVIRKLSVISSIAIIIQEYWRVLEPL